MAVTISPHRKDFPDIEMHDFHRSYYDLLLSLALFSLCRNQEIIYHREENNKNYEGKICVAICF